MRIEYSKVSPEPMGKLREIERYLAGSGLEGNLIDLVKLRASQINGCAYCIDLHARELRQAGESERRVWALQAWREAGLYSEREMAALEWTEAVTEVGESHVPEEAYRRARASFSEKELVDLTVAVALINAWNRLSIAFRRELPESAGATGERRTAGWSAGAAERRPSGWPGAPRSSHPEAGLTSTTEDQEILH